MSIFDENPTDHQGLRVTLDYARHLLALGFAPVPIKNDASKAPDTRWKQYENEPPTAAEVDRWFRNGADGIGTICGAGAGNLEMFELEGRAVDDGMLDNFHERAEEHGLGDLLDRITNPYMERSPSGGVHYLYRVSGPARGNLKLARTMHPDTAEVLVLIETRGQGGFTILAPSGGSTHPTGGAWEVLCGSIDQIATITPEERDQLHDLARTFDDMPEREPAAVIPAKPRDPNAPLSWFDTVEDDYNARCTWGQVLAGWTEMRTMGGITYWCRPGKDPRGGHSATTNAKGTDRLTAFSTSVHPGLEIYDGVGLTTTYTKFAYTAIVDHDGDRTAAANALNQQGYGRPKGARTDLRSILGPALQAGLPATPSALLPAGDSRDEAPPPGGWPVLDPAGFHGPVGDYVKAAAPHTEADPVAILVQLLVGIGCITNRGPHVVAGNDRHPAALFAAIVGATAKGKKGTSWSATRIVLDEIDAEFTRDRILGGFGSGEILIETIANEAPSSDDDTPRTRDTRTLVMEGELASQFAVMGREKSTLGPTVRNGWDGRDLAARSRGKTTAVARGYHLAIVGHITIEELRAVLSSKDTFGGTTNRFLWVASRRTRLLPEGGNVPDDIVQAAAATLRSNVRAAQRHSGAYRRTGAAAARWAELYTQMANDEPPGLLGAAIARAEAQVLRLSLTYAIADGATEIDVEHIEAAWALWCYCRATAAMIFPAGSGLSQTILDAVTGAREKGMTRTQLHNLVGRNIEASVIDKAMEGLTKSGDVVEITSPSGPQGGRPTVTAYLARYVKDDAA